MSGFFKSLGNAVNSLGSDISREVGYVSRDVNRSMDSVKSCPLLDNFKTGNVVQLISRSSGHCLQIVMSPAGHLVVDGVGPEGPAVYHAHWTVISEGQNIVRIHNNHNYIAIVNGATVVGHFPPPAAPGPETRFRTTVSGNFVMLESIKEPCRHVGILANGQLKSAIATGPEADAQFGVKLIYAPTAVAVVHTQAGAAPIQKK